MKRKILLIALTLGLNIFAFNLAEAKPQYCWDAFDNCREECGKTFWVPYLGDVCRLGCWIGFQNCGNQN